MSSRILLFLCLLTFSSGLFAQGVNFFSTDPPAFIQEFTSNLNQSKDEVGPRAGAALAAVWDSGEVTDEEKDQFISQVNIMVSKRYKSSPGLANYALIFASLKQGTSYVKLRPSEFLEVSLQTIADLDPERGQKYMKVLAEYIQQGVLIERKRFSWKATQNTPTLMYLTLGKGEDAYSAPVIRFDNTDIVYQSTQDSTRIYNTTGDFHPLAMNFIGEKGRVDWSKMGLDKEDVYCDFHQYKLNLNYGLVKVDTVDFYYKSLIEEPLVGRFEDRNTGFKDLNRANYPFFKSYQGGVVIQNFIPNVRYEGGFSLQGIRKIGSAYDIWVDYEPEPGESSGSEWDEGWYAGYSSDDMYSDEKKDDEWGEDEWDYSAATTSSFEPETTSDEWGVSETSYSGDESGGSEEEYYDDTYVDESSLYPSQIQKHVKAKIEIQRAEKSVMKIQGEAFVLDLEKMIGKNMEAIIYTSDEDSIYHPAMDMLYTTEDSTVTLKKPKRGNFKSIPFTSSYHEYFLYFETIIWDLRNDQLEFTAFIDQENKVSAIESFDYFTKARFSQFKNILPFNPIGAIYRYATMNPGRPIFPEELVKDLRVPEAITGLERMLPSLEGSGFITYDKKTKEIKPLPKLIDWARAARNKKDFDAIQVISKVDTGSHAVMNLTNMDIKMRGVSYFSLSDSAYIRVVPLEGMVTVQKDRNLTFGGAVASGKINFYSSDEERPSFTFDYESYRIMCDSIDSIRFVLVRNPPPGYEPTPLERALSNTVFEGITGAIHIDDPNNKSGEKDYPFFPVFDSYASSYLYWERPDIEGGVYKKDKMYFSVDPFVLDSLETFDGTNLRFEGAFHSSEIFPEFRQQLQVMDDFTLGFKAQSPPEGYRVYDGNGRYFNEITLDGNGLQGNGRVEYLGTVAKSDSFVFHFDSVMAEVNYFNLQRGYRGGVYFPEVDAASALYKWYTKDSVLAISSTYEALSVFGGEGMFTGTLSITPKGMVGDGEIILGQIKISGDSIVFNEMDFTADGCDFTVVDKDDAEIVHFIAKDVSVTYDVWRHTSKFETKEVGKELASFPLHQYNTTMAKGEYQRSTDDLKLEGISSYIKDNYFVSSDPKQDSLRFNAKDSYYKLDTREVVVSGVPYIYVADAMVTPEGQEVIIQDNGLIKTLENAIIEADKESKLHKIYDATVNIFSRNEYEGGGKYDYIEINGKPQFIEFNNIKVNSDTSTIASGGISDIDGFYLTERIFFRGTAELDASRKFLSFGGEVKIESENPVFKGAWFTFEKTIVNPDSVFIPIADNLTNENGDVLTVGLNFVPENRIFYSNFLQAKDADDDIEVLTASGGLTFDRRKKEFKIGSEEKLKNQVFKGATVSFNDADNTITSQGFLNFPYDFYDKTIAMKMAGSWKEDVGKRQLSTNLIMGVDFSVIPEEQLTKLADNLSFLTTASKNIDFNQRAFLENVSELLDEGNKGERETGKFLENVRNSLVYSDIKLSQQLPFTVLLSNVNFNFSRDYKALYSDSEVGLVGIAGKPINKMVGAKIVYQFGTISALGEKEPDKVTIYIEIDEFNWVYFHFEDEVVKTFSTYYDEYNYPLQAEVDKRKSESGYRFEMASENEVVKFRQDYVEKFIKNQ